MPGAISITAAKIEFAAVTLPVESFEAGAEDDFERYLERVEAARMETGRESGRASEELARAREELAKDLRSRRERIDEELKNASRRHARAEDGEAEDETGFGADRPDKATVKKAVVIAGSFLPGVYKGQLQAGLMATGNPESALSGWLLTGGGGTSAGLLKSALSKLGGLSSRFKLDQDGLGDLGEILRDSGLGDEAAQELLAGLAAGPLTLDRVLMALGKAEAMLAEGQKASGPGAYLTATADGLTSLGQFLVSLGLSTETVKGVVSGFAPGETFSSADFGLVLARGGGEELLAPCLAKGDLSSLVAALKSMGLDQKGLDGLGAMVDQNPAANLGDLLGLLAFLETPEPLALNPSKAAADVQKLLGKTSQEGELAKAPLFNEIILKLASLGDRELDSDFAELSPALQALRGGIAPSRPGEPSAQGGGGHGERERRDREERRLASMGLGGETASARAAGDGLFQSAMAGSSAGSSIKEAIAKRLEQKLLYSARNGVHRLKMNLSPESLGRLDVELKVKDDRLVAFIRAESEEAYAALESEMGALKEALAAEGLELVMTLSYEGGGEGRGGRAGRDGLSDISDYAAAPEALGGDGAQTGEGGAPSEGSRLFDRMV